MFKARNAPKNSRRKADEEDAPEADDADGAKEKEKLEEVRELQKQYRRARGVPPMPTFTEKEEAVEEEDDEQWGLLDKSFAGTNSGTKGPDLHLEAYLQERLMGKKETPAEKVRQKTREERLYEVPKELEVKDSTLDMAEHMSWVAGLAEMPLGIEYKLKNIEATEKAKREFLHGSSADGEQKGSVLEPDAITRKAFGSRFMQFNDKNSDSKSATDDAVLERFRKRMRK
eukprot:gnl/TRDRNA2_/TRDRNA2_192077_c0_seq1.p1 gnl/TRDRNA2_/TRDRNA2_192077_c0~~gnl/TRDRNA2_/TRDRNA2_192077_c0_seq1.p1  ORF type:complete len:229 (-),score=84.36 gnl/TRDRNA2_/TRDRNA2_192077_c0_seq1:60-746(-)